MPSRPSPVATAPTFLDVSAGLLFRDGRLLITQRPAGGHLAGLWEFPGGKRRPNETFEQCLVRELREELGVQVAVGRLFEEITHAYPERTVHLKFFLCRLTEGEPRPLGCADLRWVTAHELRRHAFPAADARLLERLVLARDLWAAATPPANAAAPAGDFPANGIAP